MQSIPWQKIEALEKEIGQLKTVSKKKVKTTKSNLKGLLKELEFSEKEIEEAKHSLFSFSSKWTF